MSKKALVDTIADKFQTRTAAENAVDTVFEGLKTTIANGDAVSIRGFGTFKKKDKAGREGRNPATGEAINIPAKTVIGFSSKETF